MLVAIDIRVGILVKSLVKIGRGVFTPLPVVVFRRKMEGTVL
jgi:hypothetical protein